MHRDVKPENLLLDATGADRPMVYLADFGTAVGPRTPRLTTDGQVTGTPGYLAPEAYAGAAPSPALDLYALGAVLGELLGEPPAAGATDDADLRELAAARTAADPQARPASAAQVAARLRAAARPGEWVVGEDDVEVFEQLDLAGIHERVGAGPPRDADREQTARLAATSGS